MSQQPIDLEEEAVVAELPSGRELNKPFREPKGSGKKFGVYVKNGEGNVVKVGFGDPNMEIRRDDKEARKNFRARHQCDTDPGPKWKARYWSCRMWDEEPVSKITSEKAMSQSTVTASFTAPGFDGEAPSAIVYFPKGEHTAIATKNGKPFEVTVSATVDLAGMLNAQLQQARVDAASGIASRPFIDFGHKRDAAAALPTEFYWDEEKGVMLSLEWTSEGKEAVAGKVYSYFSPEFVPDGEGGASLLTPGPIGGLVNTPAFQKIGVIAAEMADPNSDNTTTSQQPNMEQLLALLKKYGIELSPESDMSAACAALDKKLACSAELSASLETAKASLAAFEKKEKETAAAALADEAEKTVTAALNEGRITDKGVWLKAYAENPETVKAQLAALPAKPSGHNSVIKTVTANKGEAPKTVTAEQFRAMTPAEKMDFSVKGGRIA